MTSITEFYLDEEKLREGVRLPLYGASGLTGEWIQVRSMHSDEFQSAMEIQKRKMSLDDSLTLSEATLEAQIHLIAGWSFEEECNLDSIREFLKRAPHIAAKVDKLAGDNALFFPEPGKSSSHGPEKKSELNGYREEVTEASEIN